MIDNESLPENTDDVQDQGPSEQELLDAVLKNSDFIKNEEVPLPVEEDQIVDPDSTDTTEDPVESEEAVSEEVEEVEEPVEETEGEDDTPEEEVSTQEPEVFTADDLDLDAKVTVKIDGKETDVSFGDLIKGYQTDAHLSNKGREIGEAQKALEAETAEKLKEIDTLAQASVHMLAGEEQQHSKEYHELEKQIEKARKDNDTFELNELKDKRELVQQKYWNARRRREGLVAQVQKQNQEAQEKAWKDQLDYFEKEIPNLIPDFNEKVATDIREFALDKGIKPEILNQITDPAIVKFVDDYRRLEQNINKGAAKRKVVPAKKAIPAKKAPPAEKKKLDQEKMVKARAFKENATQEDQMAFLRNYASKSLGNI